MPISKYKKEKCRDGYLYYTVVKTGFYKADGTPEYKKLRAKTIKGLDEKVEEFKHNTMFGIQPSTLTVDQWFEQWFSAYKSGLRESTRNFYSSLYKTHISPQIGAVRVSQVQEIHCQKILSDISATHSIKTAKAIRTTLYSLFDKAQTNKMIIVNPAAKLKIEGKASKTRRALTVEERQAYLNTCKTHPFGDFAAMLYFFGLRRGEALALTKNDVFDDYIAITKQYSYPSNNMPMLSLPKTKAGVREIPIPDKARDYIDFNALPDGLLFCREDGRPYSYSEIVDRWRSFITAALGKETDITEHCLRHNYCTMLFECGADPVGAQELMGHNDPQTTLGIYTHFTKQIQKNNRDKALKIG
jgi:integrase